GKKGVMTGRAPRPARGVTAQVRIARRPVAASPDRGNPLENHRKDRVLHPAKVRAESRAAGASAVMERVRKGHPAGKVRRAHRGGKARQPARAARGPAPKARPARAEAAAEVTAEVARLPAPRYGGRRFIWSGSACRHG